MYGLSGTDCGVQAGQASAALDNERVVEVAGFTETVCITC